MDGLIAYALAKKYTDEHGGGSGAKTIFGSGAPNSQVVAAKGDYYWDQTNYQLYICTNYVVPGKVTDLTGLTFDLLQADVNDVADGVETYAGSYDINYWFPNHGSSSPSNKQTWVSLTTYNSKPAIYAGGGMLSNNAIFYWNGSLSKYDWSGYTTYSTWSFIDGTDVKNPDLIAFVTTYGILQGTGSHWKLIRVLPDPTSISDDKLIQYNGEWTPLSKAYPTSGAVTDRHPSNPSNNYNRSYPGSNYAIFNNGWETIRMDGSNLDILWNSASNTQSMRRHMLKSYLGNADSGLGAKIVNNTDLNTWQTCQGGSYGHISESVAATLTNCPTTTGFVLVSIVLNWGYYYNTATAASVKNSTVLRYVLADDGNVYKQAVIVDNVWNYTWGSWERLITTKEVPNAPTTDGNYVLKCSVSDGTPTYTWVEET